MSWDIFSKSKIQYFLQKLKDKFVQKETGKGLSTNDYTTTDKNKVSKIDTTTTSISGNPISISGLKANQLAVNPIITLEPIQAGSGTPSPSNIRAISGYDKIEVLSCGKNIMPSFIDAIKSANSTITWNGNSFTANGTTVTLLDNGDNILSGVKLHGTCSSQFYFYLSRPGYNDMKDILKTGFSYTVSPASIQLSDNQTQSLVGTFTIPTTWNLSNCYVYFFVSAGQHENEIIYPMLRDTSASGTFEPYHKTTDLSESLGQTVYGLEHTVRTGKARSYLKALDMANMDWQYSSGLGLFYCYVSDIAQSNPLWCSCYNPITDVISEDYTISSRYGYYVENSAIILKDTRYTDATSLKSALTGQTVVYTVAPFFETTIQLTPHEIALSQGYNYISTNGTNISLAYHNGEMASLADVSQLGETLNALEDKVSANGAGTQVNLMTYNTSTNKYVCPSDGYITLSNAGASVGDYIIISVYGANDNAICGLRCDTPIASMITVQNLFVKRGMKCYVRATSSTGSFTALFTPLA